MSPPLWVRTVVAVEGMAARGAAFTRAMRDELLWAWTRPEDRQALTLATYGREDRYVKGAPFFERGFFPWEAAVLARLALPRGARVLVGGAGGGRELRALGREGFLVTAFEPCAPLAEAASSLARDTSGAHVYRGSYDDLPAAVRGEGPLGPLLGGGPYALVLLGWRSLSHVLESPARAALFAALAHIAPTAPVVASFMPAAPTPAAGARTRALRRAFAAIGAPGRRPPRGEFFSNAGFAIALDRGDLERESSPAYELAHYDDAQGEGVAMFQPRPRARAGERA
jgi:hypothetical protein